MDYAKRLEKSGLFVYILPRKSTYTYVAIDSSEDEQNAKEKAAACKREYPQGSWVLKY